MDTNSDGLLQQGLLHLFRVGLGHVSETGDSEFRLVVSALVVSASVRVRAFEGDTVLADPVESVVHQTTVAAVVAVVGAVDKSLFGELLQFSGFDGVEAFQSADGGESQAGAALALVLDGGN